MAAAGDTGGCPHPDYVRGGLETARDIDAVVNYVAALAFVRHESAVVVGQSAGGWGAIAYDSVPHPKVAAFLVMAGERQFLRASDCTRPMAFVHDSRRHGRSRATRSLRKRRTSPVLRPGRFQSMGAPCDPLRQWRLRFDLGFQVLRELRDGRMIEQLGQIDEPGEVAVHVLVNLDQLERAGADLE
jgi:pimeloyl-ACP methyl ester carboxylesterase